MPLFHSNALFTAWAPTIAAGATLALRRALLRVRVPARRPQVPRHLLQLRGQAARVHPRHARAARRRRQPAAPRVRQRGQRSGRARFEARFNCPLTDGYGQTETGASIGRVPGTPVGSLGKGTDAVKVINPDDRRGVPAGALRRRRQAAQRRRGHGRDRQLRRAGLRGLLEERRGDARAATATARTGPATSRYRDENGFFYFAGRTADWIRVDGENFAAAPGRAHPVALGAGRPARGVRRARPRARRPRDGGDPARARGRVRRRRVRGLPRSSSTTSVRSGRPRSYGSSTSLPMTETNKILKRDLVRRALGRRRPDLVAPRPRARLRSVHPCRRRCVAGAVRGRRPRPCPGTDARRRS